MALVVGDLVARVEASTMLYRVTSVSSGVARCLPFRRSGREVFVVKIGDAWAGDGSAWRKAIA